MGTVVFAKLVRGEEQPEAEPFVRMGTTIGVSLPLVGLDVRLGIAEYLAETLGPRSSLLVGGAVTERHSATRLGASRSLLATSASPRAAEQLSRLA